MEAFKSVYKNTTVQKKHAEELKKKYCKEVQIDIEPVSEEELP